MITSLLWSIAVAFCGLVLKAVLDPHLKKISDWSGGLSFIRMAESGVFTYLMSAANLVVLYFDLGIIYKFYYEKGQATKPEVVIISFMVFLSIFLVNNTIDLLINRNIESSAKRLRIAREQAGNLKNINHRQ